VIAKCYVLEPVMICAELVRNLSCSWYHGYPDMDFTIRIPFCHVGSAIHSVVLINLLLSISVHVFNA
jgi:hypothetical protein